MIIGLTGGIASGKSTAAEYLEKKGAAVIDADKISHKISRKGEKGWQRVVEEFGEKILKDNGKLDRKKLAEIVFSDPNKRQKLEALLHPIIISEMKQSAQKYISEGKIVLFMAPLLFEAGLDRFCDEVWLIAADEDEQIKRLKKRDGLSAEEASKRINAQMSMDEKKKRSDIIIKNNGSLKKLKLNLDKHWNDITDEFN